MEWLNSRKKSCKKNGLTKLENRIFKEKDKISNTILQNSCRKNLNKRYIRHLLWLKSHQQK